MNKIINVYLSILVSKAHDGTVFSAAWSEIDLKLVTVSSGRSDSVKLWDVNEDGILQNLNAFSFHKRSVKTAGFKPQSNSKSFLFFILLIKVIRNY